jgi:hypothetical protein
MRVVIGRGLNNKINNGKHHGLHMEIVFSKGKTKEQQGELGKYGVVIRKEEEELKALVLYPHKLKTHLYK